MTKNDTLAAEAADPMPEGLPEMRPLVSLDRPTRAKALRAMSKILPKLQDIQFSAPPEDPDAPPRNAGKPAWVAYAKKLGVGVVHNATRAMIQDAVDTHLVALAPPKTVAERLEEQATLVELAADVEPLIVALAVNEDAARAWCKTASDVEVIGAVLAYQMGAQPGEAKRSSS